MKTNVSITALLSLVAAASLAGAESADRFSDRLTGDWGGARAELADAGVDVFAYFNAIVAGNVSGGVSKDSDYAGDLFYGAKFDLGPTIVTIVWPRQESGRGISTSITTGRGWTRLN